MTHLRIWFELMTAAIVLTLTVACWITLAPVQAGGQASYVVVRGNSMELRLHDGDLAIVRSAARYQPGDIVVYRYPAVGPTIHRIVAREGAQFVVKGDNNDWLDAYQPTESAIVGKFWVRLPNVGTAMSELRVPRNAALFASGLGVVAMATIAQGQRRTKRHQRSRWRVARQHAFGSMQGDTGHGLLTLSVALALVFGLLAGIAFSRPLSGIVSDEVPYQHNATFDYSAAASAGIYDTGSAQTGEPVFRQVSDGVDVRVRYTLAAENLHDTGGVYQLVAEISDANGWKQSIVLQPDTAFTGDSFSTTGVVEFDDVTALIDRLERETGVVHQQYTLAIVPKVTVQGVIGEQVLSSVFSPRLTFLMDAFVLRLANQDVAVSESLTPVQTGAVTQSQRVPNTISVVNLGLDVATARWVALAGLIASLGAILPLGLLTLLGRQSDDPASIQARYGALIMSVRSVDIASKSHLIDVGRFEDLARLAGKENQMVLVELTGNRHVYYVQGREAMYRYCIDTLDARLPTGTELGAS